MATAYKTTFHRDGTVSFWDVYQQQWQRLPAADVTDRQLASFDRTERARVIAIGLGITASWQTVAERTYTKPVTDNDGPAAGGVVLLQRRRDGDRIVERRIASNGRHQAVGKAYEVAL